MPDKRQMSLPLEAKIDEDKARYAVFSTAEISGPSREVVERGVEKYLKEYPPMGFSTRISRGPFQEEGGAWKAVMSRYTSSD